MTFDEAVNVLRKHSKKVWDNVGDVEISSAVTMAVSKPNTKVIIAVRERPQRRGVFRFVHTVMNILETKAKWNTPTGVELENGSKISVYSDPYSLRGWNPDYLLVQG